MAAFIVSLICLLYSSLREGFPLRHDISLEMHECGTRTHGISLDIAYDEIRDEYFSSCNLAFRDSMVTVGLCSI
jgi:hypothetical protein